MLACVGFSVRPWLTTLFARLSVVVSRYFVSRLPRLEFSFLSIRSKAMLNDINAYKPMVQGMARKCLNPFNIKYSQYNSWLGQVGKRDGFVCFSSLGFGLRAGVKLLYRYIHVYGLLNIEDIIERFSPRSDNQSCFDNKVAYVSRKVGLYPITHRTGFALLCQSIVATECSCVFPIEFFYRTFVILNLKFPIVHYEKENH